MAKFVQISNLTAFDQIYKCAKLMFANVIALGASFQLWSSHQCKCDSKFVAKIKFA